MDKKAFIIENDINITVSLQNLLSLQGFKVKTDSGASSIEEIIHTTKVYCPDFIILDLILANTDGFELLATIKSDNEIFSIPIFIFTNLRDKDSKVRSENLGAEYYFMKSEFSIDDFVTKTIKIIENREKYIYSYSCHR